MNGWSYIIIIIIISFIEETLGPFLKDIQHSNINLKKAVIPMLPQRYRIYLFILFNTYIFLFLLFIVNVFLVIVGIKVVSMLLP